MYSTAGTPLSHTLTCPESLLSLLAAKGSELKGSCPLKGSVVMPEAEPPDVRPALLVLEKGSVLKRSSPLLTLPAEDCKERGRERQRSRQAQNTPQALYLKRI